MFCTPVYTLRTNIQMKNGMRVSGEEKIKKQTKKK